MSPTTFTPTLGPLAGLRQRPVWTPAALGTDESWRDGDDDVGPDGDNVEITGGAVLVQDLLNALQTPLGSYPLAPAYGSELHLYLNANLDEGTRAAIAVVSEECCERDPRVEEARATVTVAGNVVRIAVSLTVATRANPLNLVVGWDIQALTLNLLEQRDG